MVEEKVGQEKSAVEEVVLGKNSCVAEEANKLEVAESEKSEIDYELKIESYEKVQEL